MSDLTWSFSQQFSSQFQTSRSDLEARVIATKASSSAPQTLLQELSLELAKLTKSLADATGSLPSYDQRQYEEQLKGLEKALSDLRTNSIPKSRFAFKRKALWPSLPESAPSLLSEEKLPVPAPIIQTPTTNLTLSSRSYEYLTIESLPTATQDQDLALSDLDHCIVNLIPAADANVHLSKEHTPLPNISALHIRNLTDTVLFLPPIAGSALIHDLSRCTIILGCHQFRMHTSHNVDVYLSISSNPIIEHCSDIRFAAYPSILLSSLDQASSHHSVQDFSHIRSTPSPHWSVLRDDRVTARWPLEGLQRREELDLVRENFLPK